MIQLKHVILLGKKINVEITSDKRGLRYLKDFHDLKITQINSSRLLKNNLLDGF